MYVKLPIAFVFGITIFGIIVFAICSFGFINAKRCRRKDAQTIAVISLIINIVCVAACIAACAALARIGFNWDLYEYYWMLQNKPPISNLQVYALIITLPINIGLTIINIISLRATHKNKTLSPNKISTPSSVCPKCGLPISGNKKFCTNCGEKLNTL